MNPLYRGPTSPMNQNNNNVYNEMMSLINEMKSGNQQAVVEKMFAKNPQAAQKVKEILQQGVSPQQAAMSMINSGNMNGLNPQQIISIINNLK